MIDILHTIDLGVCAHVVGNIFFLYAVIRVVYGGGTYKERVARLGDKMKEYYARVKSGKTQLHGGTGLGADTCGWQRLS